MENEIWKDVKGYEGIYLISSFGKVKNINSDKLLAVSKMQSVYLHNWKTKIRKNIALRQLMISNFLPKRPSKGHQVIFKNGDNTDFRLSNLHWGITIKAATEKQCSICKVVKNKKSFVYSGKSTGDICKICHCKENGIHVDDYCARGVKLQDSTCPKCRIKHKAVAKWEMCYACKCSLEYREGNNCYI